MHRLATIQWKEISLEDKSLFDQYLKLYPVGLSEYSFTNLFVWRRSRAHRWARVDQHLVVSWEADGEKGFYQPIGPAPEEVIRLLIQDDPGCSFIRLSREVAVHVDAVHEPDQDDYVYARQDLVSLKGDRYSTKRNFIKRFSKHDPKIKPITPDLIDKCLDLQEEWCNLRDCHLDPSIHAEDLAIRDALEHFTDLDLLGIAVLVGETVKGFAIGECLTGTMAVEHFEKADARMKGAYQFLLNAFASALPERIETLNREQDMGKAGLRKAKKSYHPVRMLKKFRLQTDADSARQ